jgi:signal transduction histidine kinase
MPEEDWRGTTPYVIMKATNPQGIGASRIGGEWGPLQMGRLRVGVFATGYAALAALFLFREQAPVRRVRRYLWGSRGGLLAICLLLVSVSPGAFALGDARPDILILFGNLRNIPENSMIDEALRERLSELAPGRVEVFTEYLDLEYFGDPEQAKTIATVLHAKYGSPDLRVVVTVAPSALKFMLEHREQIAPGVPIVYTSVSANTLQELAPPADVVGVTVEWAIADTLALALRQRPQARQVVMPVGSSYLDRLWERRVRAAAPPMLVQYLSGYAFAELEGKLAALKEDSIVFVPLFRLDVSGTGYSSAQAIARFAVASAAPIYTMFEGGIGSGAVGGIVTTAKQQGKLAGDIVVQILDGLAPSLIPTARTTTVPMFDWRQLQRWGIPESQLPPGAEVRFRPPSLWQEHRLLILAGAAILLLQAMLITALLFQRVRRRRAEKEAAGLSGRLLTAHEDERRRIARELHDDLTQRLARLSVDAFHVERNAGAGASQMRRDLVRLSEDVHALSYRLHPAVLDDLGLVEALRAECDRVAQHGELRVEVNAHDVPDTMPNEASLCLFRVAQEALNNAVRHGRANAITVLLSPRDSGLQLAVSDNGSGFDPERSRKRASLGLASMRERVRLLHGQLDIESTPGRGTTVVAWVPA